MIFQVSIQCDSFAFFSELNRVERHLSKKITPHTALLSPFNYKPQHFLKNPHPQSQKLKQEIGIARVMKDRGHLIQVHKAEDINQLFDQKYVPLPFKKGTNVMEFEADADLNDLNLTRVHPDATKKRGKWVTEKSQIQGQTPKEIWTTLALPQVPTYQSDFVAPVRTRMLFGHVEPHPDRPSHKNAVQYFIKDPVDENSFKNTQPIPDHAQPVFH